MRVGVELLFRATRANALECLASTEACCGANSQVQQYSMRNFQRKDRAIMQFTGLLEKIIRHRSTKSLVRSLGRRKADICGSIDSDVGSTFSQI